MLLARSEGLVASTVDEFAVAGLDMGLVPQVRADLALNGTASYGIARSVELDTGDLHLCVGIFVAQVEGMRLDL